MKNQIKIMMMFACLYSSMGFGSTTKVPVPQSLKPKNWEEWISDLRGITSPCDRVEREFLNGAVFYGDKFSPEHKAFYGYCMKNNKIARDWSIDKDDVFTPLMYFAAKNSGGLSDEQAVKIVQMFIKGGVDPNAKSRDLGTALDLAIRRTNYSLIKALLLAGATNTKIDMRHYRFELKCRAQREKNKDKEFYYFDPEHPTKHQDMLDFVRPIQA